MDRLVLFDIDKTLLVGSTVHYTALKNALSEVYGIKNPPPVKNMQGMSDLKIICETLLQENIDLKTIKSGLDQCMEIMYLKYKNALQKQDLELLEGVKELLENLQRVGIPMGLVTGNMEAIAWLKLEKVGLNKYFHFGGFGDKIVKRSGLVKNAIKASEQTLGKLDNGKIFLIGDTPRDIVGGQKVGVKTIGVATGDFSEEDLAKAGADFIVRDLKDSERVLKIILEFK
jgi:phosphoglycolate phosphatase-like HAD superfamily hydrolase